MAESYYAQCVTYSKCHSFMLSVAMLNVIMLSVVAPCKAYSKDVLTHTII